MKPLLHLFGFQFTEPTAAYSSYGGGQRRGNPLTGCGPKLLIAAGIIAFALFKFFSLPTETNKFTGKEQRLKLNTSEEIQMGLASAPQMAQQFGGLSRDQRATAHVKAVGAKLVEATDADETDYASNFEFHLLADPNTVNAFALPGGQIFITEALYRLLQDEDALAGVLGHEIGHVVGRHSSEQIAKSELLGGITTGVIVGASGDGGDAGTARIVQTVGQMINMRYGRQDELEADRLAVLFLLQAGYDPEAMIKVMEVLKKAAGGGSQPEMMSTHPNPENRKEVIRQEIERLKAKGADKPTGQPPNLLAE